MKTIVILISGRGSNMQALLESELSASVAAVISNNPRAAGLEIAQKHNIETCIVDHRMYPDRAVFDLLLANKIDSYQPYLVVLAGFMRVLGDSFINKYQGKLINIHPSLLPAFPGLDTHKQALEKGVKLHGCTVHFVTREVDHGPIIIQAAVPVLPGDTAEILAERVLLQEHRILLEAVNLFIEGQLKISGNNVEICNKISDSSALSSLESQK
tara:strand:- start:11518 stop:12156 length:639 start_codon:yes stop_codon:yes gene_type:complete